MRGAALREAALPPDARLTAAKSLHVCAYALLCVLTAWQRFAPRWRPLLLLALSAHACLTEVAQRYVPARHGCWETPFRTPGAFGSSSGAFQRKQAPWR